VFIYSLVLDKLQQIPEDNPTLATAARAIISMASVKLKIIVVTSIFNLYKSLQAPPASFQIKI
jgi:hypothetical protein